METKELAPHNDVVVDSTNLINSNEEEIAPAAEIKKKHISFSELYIWEKCAFLHKRQYIDKLVKGDKSHYLSFGTALHHICEHHIYDELEEQNRIFRNVFKEGLEKEEVPITEPEFEEYCNQASRLFVNILPTLLEQFGEGFKIVQAELPLYEKIDFFLDEEYFFKGYIDLVVEDAKGRIHLIDWKTTSWGWDLRKRTDKMTTYQLTLYKIFYSLKFNVDPKNIDIHFILLKRTAKANSNVEVYTVPCGDIKMKNCKLFLKNALYNIFKERYIKNRSSCGFCPIHKTELCP